MRAFTDHMNRMDGSDRRSGELYDDLEREPDGEPEESRDLTLGMTALLGIFFAVVLVCAVFFGFGYSSGRTLHAAKAPIMFPKPAPRVAPAADTGAAPEPNTAAAQADTDAAGAPAFPAARPAAKPSAGAALTDASGTQSTGAANDSSYAAGQLAAIPAFAAPARPLASRASYVPQSAAAPADPGSSAVMVQIAAVMHPQDAEALAQALRRNGFAAVVRSGAQEKVQDKFLHVQVGPFATREQAKAMRARLQADGYDPILKP